jgi:hypothetical protein
MPQIFVLPRPRALDDDANPLAGALLYFFQTGTEIPQAVHSDTAQATPITQPVTGNSAGEFQKIYLNPNASANYRVRLTTADGVLLYQEDDIDRFTVSQAEIALTFNPRTPAEIAETLVPVSYRYPEGHGRRYGMIGNGVANDTSACSTWLSFCYGHDVEAVIDSGTFLIADVSVSISGGRLNGGFKITGSGINVTRFKPFGTPSVALITFDGAAAGQPNSVQMMMRDLSFWGVAKSCDGVVFNGIASFRLEDVQIDGFDVGLDLQSSLICNFNNCIISANNTGVRTRLAGGAYCNLIAFRDCMINSNSVYGADLGAANGIKFDGCDIELNGASCPTSTVTIASSLVTWTGHGLSSGDPVIFTTSGTLPVELTPNVIYYAVVASANTFGVATTVGGSDISLTGSGSGTHTAISPNTGAVVIRKTCIDELGYALFDFDSNWLEGNNGAAIRAEYMTSAFGLEISVNGGHILGTGNSYSFAIGLARSVAIRDHHCVAGSDIANISCDNLLLENSRFITLTRPSVSYSTIIGSAFNSVDYQWGETGSSTLTLTDCTTSPTGTATWLIQGRDVTIDVPDITATSNTTAATLTGLPPNLAPSVARLLVGGSVDSGTANVSAVRVETSGVITLFDGFGAFTNSGTKGSYPFTLKYRK